MCLLQLATYLSLMVSQVEMQLEMYKCTNSVGSSTAVVSLKSMVGHDDSDAVQLDVPVDHLHAVQTHLHVDQD